MLVGGTAGCSHAEGCVPPSVFSVWIGIRPGSGRKRCGNQHRCNAHTGRIRTTTSRRLID
jgi:hypothetical protein